MSKNKIFQTLILADAGGGATNVNGAQMETFADIEAGDVLLGFVLDNLVLGAAATISVNFQHERPGTSGAYVTPIDITVGGNLMYSLLGLSANTHWVSGHSALGVGISGHKLYVLPGMRARFTWNTDPLGTGNADLYAITQKEFS